MTLDVVARVGRMFGTKNTSDAADNVVRTARHMGTLLGGGITPARMFEILGRESTGAVSEMARAVAEGTPPVEALARGPGPTWRVLAVAWDLAAAGGAPLSPVLSRIGDALADLERLRERRSVILAGPKSTVTLVSSLPPVTLLLGMVLGFDPAPILGSAVGAALVAAGGLLLVCGVGWARVLQRHVETGDRVSGLECELAWIVLRGGSSPDVAPKLVADAVDRFGAEWVPFDRFLARSPLRRTIAAASAAGVPLTALLLEEADTERAQAHARLEREAEQLGIRVLVPLAVCVLPSFILVGVVPVVLSMLRM